ncbi:uncharacterized protein LOC122022532 isoform X3 [Zingiber officinale]|uniref:uncharacterized protein LOC122022532 isoform X3 n=1 Tax=Zingiber officinale TaxID=94328 RepID=UPI001C4B60B1|nr:uncharacterized protein LOC122022532 isoform X3 [Zingiber officinale]
MRRPVDLELAHEGDQRRGEEETEHRAGDPDAAAAPLPRRAHHRALQRRRLLHGADAKAHRGGWQQDHRLIHPPARQQGLLPLIWQRGRLLWRCQVGHPESTSDPLSTLATTQIKVILIDEYRSLGYAKHTQRQIKEICKIKVWTLWKPLECLRKNVRDYYIPQKREGKLKIEETKEDILTKALETEVSISLALRPTSYFVLFCFKFEYHYLL